MERVSSKAAKGVTVTPILRKHLHSFNRNKYWRSVSGRVVPVNINSLNERKIANAAQHGYNRNDEYDLTLLNNQNKNEIAGTSILVNSCNSTILPCTLFDTISLETNRILPKRARCIPQPKTILLRSPRDHFIVTNCSFNEFIASFAKNDASCILSSIPSLELHQKRKSNRKTPRCISIGNEFKNLLGLFDNNEKKKKKQRRRIGALCPPCPICCCLAAIVGAILLLMGLIALLTYIFTSTHKMAMSTTSTTAPTTASTTVTSTTTTSTITSSTSTSTTTTTTTTTSPTTTPAPPCAATSVGSASTLYTATSGSTQYSCFAYAWASPVTGPVTLAFQLRNDPSMWNLDNVTVYSGATEMLMNTNFETGSLSPWLRTTPNGLCSGIPGGVYAYCTPLSGSYALCDGSSGCADEISQQFNATAGQLYIVSFWLKSASTGSGISVVVTLS